MEGAVVLKQRSITELRKQKFKVEILHNIGEF